MHLAAYSTDSQQVETLRELKVIDIGANTFTLSWRKTPGVTGYKIAWIPFAGEYLRYHYFCCVCQI